MKFFKRVLRAIKSIWCIYFTKCTPVLIYAPGRVGSVSLIESFDKANIFAIKLENLENRVWHSTNFVREHIISKQKPAQIITMVREPVSFLVAYYFSVVPKSSELMVAANRNDIDFLGQEFVRRCLHDWPFEHYLGWYERELPKTTGVDLIESPFDYDKKWSYIENSTYPTLVLRSDLDDNVKQEVIKETFGYEILIQRSNEGTGKTLYAVYDNFKRSFKLSGEEFEKIYSTQMAKHFFSSEEHTAARKRWCKI